MNDTNLKILAIIGNKTQCKQPESESRHFYKRNSNSKLSHVVDSEILLTVVKENLSESVPWLSKKINHSQPINFKNCMKCSQ